MCYKCNIIGPYLQNPGNIGRLMRSPNMWPSLGFDGIELPVRPGFQVEPDRAERELPQFARVMRAHGLSITSVASTIAEPVFAGCQACGNSTDPHHDRRGPCPVLAGKSRPCAAGTRYGASALREICRLRRCSASLRFQYFSSYGAEGPVSSL